MSRDEFVMAMRPVIPTENAATAGENFQNTTLRPVLKLQHDALVTVFSMHHREIEFPSEPTMLRQFIQARVSADHVLSNTLTGMVIGLFTTDELFSYREHRTEINKRIRHLLVTRIFDGITQNNGYT